MPSRRILFFALACVVLAVALVGATLIVQSRRADADLGTTVVTTGEAQVGGPFQLVDQTGQAVDESVLDGRWSLVFFGFTHCPDYCPTTLQMLDAIQRQLGAEGEDMQIVFISIDPERDTPEALADYLQTSSFPEGVIGLTGTPEQVDQAADAYRAFYEKVGEGDAYLMNHSLAIYLMGPDGRFRTTLSSELGPERSAELIRRAMSRG
ncbi:SCO family protein [Brevundimonas lutea]|uniref:SCO family protein n=1 Tax=Brevundimonas lutea TaxID=2293980 RepID=UPI000F021CEF|nr:SCO family protein [Brevundimonas lutea]